MYSHNSSRVRIKEESNTGLYFGIGIAVFICLVLVIVLFVLGLTKAGCGVGWGKNCDKTTTPPSTTPPSQTTTTPSTPTPQVCLPLDYTDNVTDFCYACKESNFNNMVKLGLCDPTTLKCSISSDGKDIDKIISCNVGQNCPEDAKLPSCDSYNVCYICADKNRWSKYNISGSNKYMCSTNGSALDKIIECK